MKVNRKSRFIRLATISATIVMLSACYELESLTQPGDLPTDTTFTVDIVVSGDQTGYVTPRLGIMVPEAWVMPDSISYTVASDSLGMVTGTMFALDTFPTTHTLDSLEEGFSWWLAATTDTLQVLEYDFTSFSTSVQIETDSTAGFFDIVYYIHHYSWGGAFPIVVRRPVSVGLANLVEVNNSDDDGPGSLRQAMREVAQGGEILITESAGDTLQLLSPLRPDRDFQIVNPGQDPYTLVASDTSNAFYIKPNFADTLTIGLTGLHLVDGQDLEGGAIYCGTGTELFLNDCRLHSNQAQRGGAIYAQRGCRITLSATQIHHNQAPEGGGLRLVESQLETSETDLSSIYANEAGVGRDIYLSSWTNVGVLSLPLDTFSVLETNSQFAYPRAAASISAEHGYFTQHDADIFVSPTGDDLNSGLSASEPKRTIQAAMLAMVLDSSNVHTVHLSEGTYSSSTNGESFPLRIPEYLNLQGNSRLTTFLDAEDASAVLHIRENPYLALRDLTVQRGYTTINDYNHFDSPERWSAGLAIIESSVDLQRVTIRDNSGATESAGMTARYSWVTMTDVNFFNNLGGSTAGLHVDDSEIVGDTLTFIGNSGGNVGAISAWHASLELDSLQILSNTGGTGGIQLQYSDLEANVVHLEDNTGYNTGGIWNGESEMRLSNSVIRGNGGSSVPAMVLNLYDTTHSVHVSHTLIVDNITNDVHGSAVHAYNSASDNIHFDHVTLANNSGQNNRGLYANGPVSISNSIIWANSITSWQGNQDLTINRSILPHELPGIQGDDNLIANPLFCEPENGNYFLADNSPALGAGTDGSNMGALGAGGCGILVAVDENILPWEYDLQQNYPNPFNPSTTIRFALPEAAEVSLNIYDLRGRLVSSFADQHLEAGYHDFVWSGRDKLGKSLAAGMYYCRMTTSEYSETIKMLYLK